VYPKWCKASQFCGWINCRLVDETVPTEFFDFCVQITSPENKFAMHISASKELGCSW
jgi:hypothetical protein